MDELIITMESEEMLMYMIAKGIHTHTSVFSVHTNHSLHSQASPNTRREKESAFVVTSSSIDELELVVLEMSNKLNRTTTFNLFKELNLVRKIS